MTKAISSDINAVLEKLMNDDTFRAGMLGDPVGTLSRIGISLDPSQVPAERSLPSKETLAADQTAVNTKLESSLGMIIFMMYGNDRSYTPAGAAKQSA